MKCESTDDGQANSLNARQSIALKTIILPEDQIAMRKAILRPLSPHLRAKIPYRPTPIADTELLDRSSSFGHQKHLSSSFEDSSSPRFLSSSSDSEEKPHKAVSVVSSRKAE